MSDQNESQQPKEPESGAEQTSAPAAVPAQSGKKTELPSQRPDVSYTLLSNGMDYLVSVFQHLTEGATPPSARDLKYTVLHLQAATEVLLKARLVHEHFSLVFADPREATYDKWKSGKFKSCGTLDAFDRLRRIARLALSDDDRDGIAELAKDRNALQHYGLTHNAHAVEFRAAIVLEFLNTFIHEHLIPELDPAEAARVERNMDSLRLQFKGIKTLVKQRMNNLRSALAKVADVTVKCPDCEQWALVADGAEAGPTCRFCYQSWDYLPQSAAANYAWIILGLDENSNIADGYDPPVTNCPNCEAYALVTEAVTAADPSGTTPLCFACGNVFHHLTDCGGCGTMMDSGQPDRLPLCSNCARLRYPGEALR
ncbi:hypothetical protein AB0K86_19940 [Streptomyces clavifer]|uniref:hypothetical protein n=1 Tax=Streptomyces clavifer TaxID=68188 RepID=UPI0034182430